MFNKEMASCQFIFTLNGSFNAPVTMLFIHFLQSTFKLYFRNTVVTPETITIGVTDFHLDDHSNSGEGFLGFFDWLRSDAETIVGIRIAYFENLGYTETLAQFPYMRQATADEGIELLFHGTGFVTELSRDHDFLSNYVYRSGDGEYVFTFSLNHLTDLELLNLSDRCEAFL